MGALGRPFSKIQVVVGVLQFFIWPFFLRYIWVIGWTVLIFVRAFQAPKAVDANVKESHDLDKVEDNNYDRFE